ncbi:MAG: DUF2268 domain-containing putative Zn-dependent protease [bacterium]
MRKIRLGVLAGLCVALAACSAGDTMAQSSDVAVSAADVHRFVAAWARLDPRDSTCDALKSYWDSASPGLIAYRSKYSVSMASVCADIRVHPAQYAQLQHRLPEFDSAVVATRRIYAQFAQLHPMRNNPAVYFVVGNGVSGGTTTNGSHPIILIGAERNKSAAGIPGAIAHELTHTQQDYPYWGSLTGGPAFLRGSVLRNSIKEGAADLLKEIITGESIRSTYGEAHEQELWTAFQRDANSKDYRLWLYNGWNAKELGDRPNDLGYWMGYRISKAYYDHASDKQQAISDILSIRDFPAFLLKSGYAGVSEAARASAGRP